MGNSSGGENLLLYVSPENWNGLESCCSACSCMLRSIFIVRWPWNTKQSNITKKATFPETRPVFWNVAVIRPLRAAASLNFLLNSNGHLLLKGLSDVVRNTEALVDFSAETSITQRSRWRWGLTGGLCQVLRWGQAVNQLEWLHNGAMCDVSE